MVTFSINTKSLLNVCVGLLSLPDFDLELASASASSLSVTVAANITSSSSSVSSSRGTELSNLQVVLL